MGDYERRSSFGEQSEPEFLDPHHFYAAYIFDQANEREHEIETLIEQAKSLGYPVRYLWLSEAMDLQGFPDRLIVCVQHPSRSKDAGMDLYTTLKQKNVFWDDLDAATLEEYQSFGKPIKALRDLHMLSGTSLFPTLDIEGEYQTRRKGILLQIIQDDVREEAEGRLGRELSDEEFAAVLTRVKKSLDLLDWTFYVEEALHWCEESGQIAPDSDETKSKD